MLVVTGINQDWSRRKQAITESPPPPLCTVVAQTARLMMEPGGGDPTKFTGAYMPPPRAPPRPAGPAGRRVEEKTKLPSQIRSDVDSFFRLVFSAQQERCGVRSHQRRSVVVQLKHKNKKRDTATACT